MQHFTVFDVDGFVGNYITVRVERQLPLSIADTIKALRFAVPVTDLSDSALAEMIAKHVFEMGLYDRFDLTKR
ncbi:hypothetical protein QBK99_21120 [Corticibacterium sp. UT-5YL-CI-8]|nr:hypothetical protein [Tianweitania sp. UT-5YL-CI-8]